MDIMIDRFVTTRSAELFSAEHPFTFECGRTLNSVTVAYETYGTLNAAKDNAILVCHALTGSAHAAGYSSADASSAGWWHTFIGEGKPIDTSKYFVVSSNFLGGCYGTTGSSSIDPATGKPYGLSFPQMTVRDMVTVQHELLRSLGVDSLTTVIGGSLGGMQVLEWAVMFPEMVRSIIPIATSAQHSPWAVALNDMARQAITNDPAWKNGEYYSTGQPHHGLSLARQIAMLTYRSGAEFAQRFGRDRRSDAGKSADRFDAQNIFQVESYLRHQGEKLVARFDANTYLQITRAMDLHDIAWGRGSVNDVLRTIACPALCIGIDSDVLYPASEQQEIAGAIPSAHYREISSPYGHDAFLIEFDQMAAPVREFLASLRQ